MEIPEFLRSVTSSPPAWLQTRNDNGIVVSSRVRLARNLAERMFPDHLPEDERIALWRQIKTILTEKSELKGSLALEMGELAGVSKQILFERHLISREHLQRGSGSGIVVRRDEFMAVMVNEEDHLRIQSFRPGLDLAEAWRGIDSLDSAIEQEVDYVFSPALGYLTCCPTNVGTGMRASVMLHLPALALLDEIRPVVNGLGKIGLMVRGLWGEGSDIAGDMFQVSNQITLGKEEIDIIEHLGHIIRELAEHEEHARARLLERHESLAKDHVGRARGILDNAHILSSKEALDLLSALRLGIDTGLIGDYQRDCIDELLLWTQPAHLQMIEGRRLEAHERDEARAERVRTHLRQFGKQKKGNNNE